MICVYCKVIGMKKKGSMFEFEPIELRPQNIIEECEYISFVAYNKSMANQMGLSSVDWQTA